jgi:hypothetical protein
MHQIAKCIPAGHESPEQTTEVALYLEPLIAADTVNSVQCYVMLSSCNLFIIIDSMNVIFTEKLSRSSHMVMTFSHIQDLVNSI